MPEIGIEYGRRYAKVAVVQENRWSPRPVMLAVGSCTLTLEIVQAQNWSWTGFVPDGTGPFQVHFFQPRLSLSIYDIVLTNMEQKS